MCHFTYRGVRAEEEGSVGEAAWETWWSGSDFSCCLSDNYKRKRRQRHMWTWDCVKVTTAEVCLWVCACCYAWICAHCSCMYGCRRRRSSRHCGKENSISSVIHPRLSRLSRDKKWESVKLERKERMEGVKMDGVPRGRKIGEASQHFITFSMFNRSH